MARKKQNLAALAALLGTAALTSRKGVDLGPLPDYDRDAFRQAYGEEKPEAEPLSSGMRKGGYVKAADGCAKRGKTKGRLL